MMKKSIAALLTIMLLLPLAVFGAAAGEAPASDVVLTLMASQDWIQDAEIELGQKFTEETGITVDYQIIPSDQYDSLVMTKLNTGEVTDIYCKQSGRFDIVDILNVQKNAMDLSGESWAANVEALAAAELSVEGKLYGQPIQDMSAVWAVGYNKAIFEELGLAIPKTYAEFAALCDAILAVGKTPIYEAVADGWHHTLWFPEGAVAAEVASPGFYDLLNNNETTLAENETLLTIVTQIKDMIDKGYWGDNYMSNEYANGYAAMASGEYVMMLDNQGLGGQINAADPNFDPENIGFFVIPLADNQTLNMNPAGPARFVNPNSPNADAALQYLEFMARDESLAYMTDNVPKFFHLAYTNAPSNYPESIQTFYDSYPTSETVLQTAVKYVNPQWTEIGNSISALALGELTPETFLQDMDDMRAELAQAAGDPQW